VVRGGRGSEAEQYIIDRVNRLDGWSASNANTARANQPGFDVVARHENGWELRISVKSVSTGGRRHDYGIGRSFGAHPADVYAFVDLTAPAPWPVYLAGARTVERLALERHRHYQAARGRPADTLNTWSPKVSRGLLEAIGARENPSTPAASQADPHPRAHHVPSSPFRPIPQSPRSTTAPPARCWRCWWPSGRPLSVQSCSVAHRSPLLGGNEQERLQHAVLVGPLPLVLLLDAVSLAVDVDAEGLIPRAALN
jgi:hypothetical protein